MTVFISACSTMYIWSIKQRKKDMYEHFGVNEFAKNRWAVVGFDYDTALQLISDIETSSEKEVLRKTRTKHEIRTEFTDGTLLRWVPAYINARGHKFGKMWCDKSINEEELRCRIMPMYFGKREDITWL